MPEYLLAEKAFSKVDIYEQRDRVGGIWNLSEPIRSRRIPIPQTDPRYGHHRNGGDYEAETSELLESLEFESPLYDYLETNIPKQLMAFSDQPFAETQPLFPSHQAVLRYLEDHADDVRHLIKFDTAVMEVRSVVDEPTRQEKWDLMAEDLTTQERIQESYDAVVIASGHYTVPYVPDIKGLKEWNAAYTRE